jgi:hypothetical protein
MISVTVSLLESREEAEALDNRQALRFVRDCGFEPTLGPGFVSVDLPFPVGTYDVSGHKRQPTLSAPNAQELAWKVSEYVKGQPVGGFLP